jgi:hypothetical protein
MRLLLAIASCLALGLTSCGFESSEGDDVSARDAEASYVAAVEEAVPLAARAVSAKKVEVVGYWQTCMGGYQYRGNGAIHVEAEADDTQIEKVRTALTDAGWTDTTQVDGHVSVEKDGLSVDLRQPGGALTGIWGLSFRSECRLLDGSDKDYVEQTEEHRFTDLGS